MSDLAEKRRWALMTVGERYGLQLARDRAADPWTDPSRLITRRSDMTILIDGKTAEELAGNEGRRR
jgi:hypothetical protein